MSFGWPRIALLDQALPGSRVVASGNWPKQELALMVDLNFAPLNVAGTTWDDPGSTAFIGGFQLGYNLQAGHFLVGVEGDFDWVMGRVSPGLRLMHEGIPVRALRMARPHVR